MTPLWPMLRFLSDTYWLWGWTAALKESCRPAIICMCVCVCVWQRERFCVCCNNYILTKTQWPPKMGRWGEPYLHKIKVLVRVQASLVVTEVHSKWNSGPTSSYISETNSIISSAVTDEQLCWQELAVTVVLIKKWWPVCVDCVPAM